jgi:hypothetical protein
MRLRSAVAWLLIIILLLVSPRPAAADEDESVIGDHWGVRIGFNYSSWDGLGDLEPAGSGGPFRTTGNGLEFDGYTSIAKQGDNWLFAGVATRFLGFNTSLLEDFPDDSALDATFIDVFLRYRFRDPGRNYVDVDAGLGYYIASTMYIDCSFIQDCLGDETFSEVLGGFVGLNARLMKGLVVGARVHFADFGTINAIGPESGDLTGPIYTAYVSWEFGRW